MSITEKDGIPPGKYRVYITGAVTYGDAPAPRPSVNTSDGYNPGANASYALPASISLIDRKYRSVETSGLEADIKGAMTYNITVEKP